MTPLTIHEESRGRMIARWLLMLFYAVAGIGHLLATDAMVKIVPDGVPHPRVVVIATGLCELAGVWALASQRWRRSAGWAFALYALCVWPANVKHAVHDLGTATGLPIWYHGPRLLLQPVIIWWALWATRIVDWPFAARTGTAMQKSGTDRHRR